MRQGGPCSGTAGVARTESGLSVGSEQGFGPFGGPHAGIAQDALTMRREEP